MEKKLLKFEAEDREFSKLEQFIQTVKGQKKILVFRNMQQNLEKAIGYLH